MSALGFVCARPRCRGLAIGLAGGLAAAMIVVAAGAARAAGPEPVGIAVFDFVLDDRSAAGGVVAPDPIDLESLAGSTAEARRLLAETGRYKLVDPSPVADQLAAQGGIQHCEGCEAALAARLGAERTLVGVITRVSRTEYTLQIQVRDAASGAVVANAFTGLRMGANYAWPRGAKSLVKNKILAAMAAQ